MKPLIVCDHITKKAGNFILRDIHFSLEPGYIMAIIGSNGAGKSTFVRTLLGSYKLYNHMEDYTDHTAVAKTMAVNKGDIIINGKSVKYNPKEYKEEIAFILNDSPFAMSMSARDNGIFYGSYYETFNRKQYEQLCMKYEVPLEIALNKLSKGEQIKMQIAFALARTASVYVLDEPTGNLDIRFREEFYEIMRELVKDGNKSILYVTHLVEDLEVLADYILWIEAGEQKGFGTLESLMDEYRLYFGLVDSLPDRDAYEVVAVKQNPVHTETLLRSTKGTFSELVEMNSQRATLKEIMYYEKEAEEAEWRCRC